MREKGKKEEEDIQNKQKNSSGRGRIKKAADQMMKV